MTEDEAEDLMDLFARAAKLNGNEHELTIPDLVKAKIQQFDIELTFTIV